MEFQNPEQNGNVLPNVLPRFKQIDRLCSTRNIIKAYIAKFHRRRELIVHETFHVSIMSPCDDSCSKYKRIL